MSHIKDIKERVKFKKQRNIALWEEIKKTK